MKYKLIDLFCGAGGFSLGFESLGSDMFEVVLALDSDRSACESYEVNFGVKPNCSEIESWLKTADVPKADVVIGGLPCQAFSRLNKNTSEDPRKLLYKPFLDVVKKSQASCFVVENVPMFLLPSNFRKFETEASKLGFSLLFQVLNAAEFGVPQNRKRAIIIGVRNKNFTDLDLTEIMPKPSHGKKGSGLKSFVTVRDAICNLPEPTEQFSSSRELQCFRLKPTPLSLVRYKNIPLGGNWRNLPDTLLPPSRKKAKSMGKSSFQANDLFGRLHWDEPSVTIRTDCKPEKGRYLHPEENRVITLRECAKLQSFDENFEFTGNKGDINKQIGNAVPPLLSKVIAANIYLLLHKKSLPLEVAA